MDVTFFLCKALGLDPLVSGDSRRSKNTDVIDASACIKWLDATSSQPVSTMTTPVAVASSFRVGCVGGLVDAMLLLVKGRCAHLPAGVLVLERTRWARHMSYVAVVLGRRNRFVRMYMRDNFVYNHTDRGLNSHITSHDRVVTK